MIALRFVVLVLVWVPLIAVHACGEIMVDTCEWIADGLRGARG